MDGSTASLIVIPIVTTLALAAWLLLVAYAVSHPWWKHGTATASPENPVPAGRQISPALGLTSARQVSGGPGRKMARASRSA